jgi:thiol-disulfide isomerase/thioredoxin
MCFRVVGILWLGLVNVAMAANPVASAVLHLTNDSYLPGELRGSDDPNVVRWHSPIFGRPLEFPLSAVKAVNYPVPAAPAPPSGEYCFELVDDDVIYGDLLALTDAEVELNSPRVGRLHIRRESIRRLYRWKGADSVYLGPNGLAGWTESAPTSQWRDEGGQPASEQLGATLFADLGMPDKAVIEVEISWKKKPDFVLALGVDARDAAIQQAFRVEAWGGDLVVIGESARDADVALVQHNEPGEGRIRLQMYLDQEQRHLIVLSRGGKPLASLKITGSKPSVQSGVRLTNGNGDVRLEHLRISRWNGLPLAEVRDDRSRLHRTDGSIVYGQIAAFDPNSKQFIIRNGATETHVPQDTIADMFLAPAKSANKETTDPTVSRTLRVVYRDGSRFSGRLTRIEDGHLSLTCPGVKEPLRLPLAEVRSVISLRHESTANSSPVAGKPGRLEMDGVSLKGRLVGDRDAMDASGLVWRPDLSLNSSPMIVGLSGRIVYRDPPPPKPPSAPPVTRQARQAQPKGFGQAVAEAMLNGLSAVPPASGGRRALYLRTGDTIPCEVVRIDEKGVTFRTPLSDATFVAHDKIKGVELIAKQDGPKLNMAKRDRLLTLPRMQKDSPPTHLICSKNGDFLRGRIVEMDESKLRVEVRLEIKEVPRDRVAQIFWLHADELADGKVPSIANGASQVTRAQTMDAAGNRLTFDVAKADDKTISGASEVLGACRADLADVDQLLFGAVIEQSAAKLAHHLWKLHPAIEPKFVQGDPNAPVDDGTTGLESPLVGKPAPAVKLDLLDGKKLNLADHKGRVVVLDFWATWCGPCLQALPLVDGVAREFAGQEVELFAINMEEQPDTIKSMLERHKLKMAVALDRDGVVAARYAVTAIPQTVVIDRDGKVARIFVGGGQKTADALRKAIQELTAVKSGLP